MILTVIQAKTAATAVFGMISPSRPAAVIRCRHEAGRANAQGNGPKFKQPAAVMTHIGVDLTPAGRGTGLNFA